MWPALCAFSLPARSIRLSVAERTCGERTAGITTEEEEEGEDEEDEAAAASEDDDDDV